MDTLPSSSGAGSGSTLVKASVVPVDAFPRPESYGLDTVSVVDWAASQHGPQGDEGGVELAVPRGKKHKYLVHT